MAKAKLDFSGFDALMADIEAMGGDVQEAATEALEQTHAFVTDGLEKAMKSQKINGKPVNWEHTGRTKETLRKEAEILVAGNIFSVKTGFEWPTAAKYLAYGRGTPRMTASSDMKKILDPKKIQEQVMAIQEEALEKYIERTMGR